MNGRHREGIRQKKSLGQVFLNTDWPVRKVVDTVRSWDVTKGHRNRPRWWNFNESLTQRRYSRYRS
jgi:hypothetical protein